MKKIIILLLVLFLVSCEDTTTVQEPTPDAPVVETPVTDEPVVETPVETELTIDEKFPMPELPDMDYTGLDFFEDGYQIVDLVSCTDGDTAVFNLNGSSTATRFLAVDTPETSNGVDPWGPAAKVFTCNLLTNASEIILQNDDESDVWDTYDRLLAFIWADGELVQYKLVRESLAWVKYLYGNYSHNPLLIGLEASVQREDLKIWGQEDPAYNYSNAVITLKLYEIANEHYGKTLSTTGIITGILGNNVFIQDGDKAIYLYTNNIPYNAIINYGVGTEIAFTADLQDYNGLAELLNIVDKKIVIVSEGNDIPAPIELTLAEIGEEYESKVITVKGVTIISVDPDSNSKGFSVMIEKDGVQAEIRIDKYLKPFIEESFFVAGDVIDATGNLGQFNETYQIMIRTVEDIIK